MLANKITTHVTDSLNRLLEQYRGRVNITGLITAVSQHVQKIEDALYPVDQYRQLLSSYGQQLDNLGEIIGLKRNGLPDNQYLVLLLGTIAENNSDTTPTEMLNIVKTVFQATSVFIKDPNSTKGTSIPAQVAFAVGSPTFPASLYPVIEQIILLSVGAAISVSYLVTFNAQGCFAFSGNQSWTKPKLTTPGFTPSSGNPWPFGFGAYSYAPNAYMGGAFGTRIYKDPKQ